MIQEALTNTYRHAAASRVTIGLRLTANVVKLWILDDGCGLARAVRVAAGDGALLGVGIAGMQARLIQFGGSLRLLSGGRGTMVVATVPLRSGAVDKLTQEIHRGNSGFPPSSVIPPSA